MVIVEIHACEYEHGSVWDLFRSQVSDGLMYLDCIIVLLLISCLIIWSYEIDLENMSNSECNLNIRHLSSQFCLSEEMTSVYFIDLPLLRKCSILSWTFNEAQNMGLVLWPFHATLCYSRPLVALSSVTFFISGPCGIVANRNMN